MNAYSSVSGGAMFVPDQIKRKKTNKSYKDLAKAEKKKPVKKWFGSKKAKSVKKAA